MELRKTDVLVKFGVENGLEVVIEKCPPLDFKKVQPLPSLRHALSRVYTLKSEGYPDPTWVVAKELWYAWIYANLPPFYESWIKKVLEKEMKRINKLKWTHLSKRKKSWETEMKQLILDLDNGLDLRSNNQATLNLLTEELGIEVGEDEDLLYQDNCVPGEDGRCRMKVVVGGDDKVWLRETIEAEKKAERREDLFQKRKSRITKDREALMNLKVTQSAEDNPEIADPVEVDIIDSDTFIAHPRCEASKVVQNLSDTQHISTRSKPSTKTEDSKLKPVRTSFKCVDDDIIEVMVNMECQYGVDKRQVAPLLAYIMNKLAGQRWEAPSEESELLECDEPGKRKFRDLTFVLPSRKSMQRKLDDAAMLNFKFVAEVIEKTNELGGTVTSGWDDTVKAAGHRLHDVKSGRVTCTTKNVDIEGNEKRVRQSLTTGFLPNISHSGLDSATAVRSSISQLAVLCDVQYEEMIDFIDFFMNDRAGDSDVMLDQLGIEETKRLKCNAHVILCIQNAIDKVLKDKETEIGVVKLISTDAQHVFSSPSNSIFTLGLIAFAKFLSPSHSQLNISLYSQYKIF